MLTPKPGSQEAEPQGQAGASSAAPETTSMCRLRSGRNRGAGNGGGDGPRQMERAGGPRSVTQQAQAVRGAQRAAPAAHPAPQAGEDPGLRPQHPGDEARRWDPQEHCRRKSGAEGGGGGRREGRGSAPPPPQTLSSVPRLPHLTLRLHNSHTCLLPLPQTLSLGVRRGLGPVTRRGQEAQGDKGPGLPTPSPGARSTGRTGPAALNAGQSWAAAKAPWPLRSGKAQPGAPAPPALLPRPGHSGAQVAPAAELSRLQRLPALQRPEPHPLRPSPAGRADKEEGPAGPPHPLAFLPSTPPPRQPAVLQLPEAPTLQVAELWLGPEWARGGGWDALCLPHLPSKDPGGYGQVATPCQAGKGGPAPLLHRRE